MYDIKRFPFSYGFGKVEFKNWLNDFVGEIIKIKFHKDKNVYVIYKEIKIGIQDEGI